MAYQLKSKTGQPIKKDGFPIMGSDQIGVKIEQLDDVNLTFLAVASTEDEDRDKDILRQDGWSLKNFKKNPIIPWSHNYWELPIAKSIRTWIDSTKKRLLIKPKFDPNDEFSKKIFNKYANGFLTSFSVGFRGIDFKWRDENNQWGGGKEFTKMELLEVSAVAVPANPNASVSLSLEEAGIVKSMLDIGYPEYFSRRKDNWLFYPIRDVGQFSSPKQVPIENINGAFAIMAKAIDEKHPEAGIEQVVGYSFDPSEFDKDLAVDYVRDYGEKTCKTFYYKLDFDDEKGVSINEISEEYTIDVTDDVKDIEWGDPNTVHGYTYRIWVDKSKLEEQAEKDLAPVKVEPDESCRDEEPTPPEIGVPEDEEKNEMLEMLKTLEMQNKFLTDQFNVLSAALETLSKAVAEKLVVKQEEICNNVSDPVVDTTLEFDDEEVTPPTDQKEADGDDELEITDTPPEEKGNESGSDDTIEIDEAELKLVGDSRFILVNLKENLKKHLNAVVKDSGKID